MALRNRLALVIAAVFVPAGLLLVIVQQVAFSRLIDAQFMYKVEQLRVQVPQAAPGELFDSQPGDIETGPADQATDNQATDEAGEGALSTVSAPDLEGIAAAAEHVKAVAATWTLALTGLFAVAAVLAAWLLAGRAFARVRQVTSFVRGVSPQTLGARMALSGPSDEITELAATFDALLARLDAEFTARRRFVSNASHELRTPLATNRLGIQMAIRRLEQGKDPSRPLQTALEANRGAERVIASLLALALVTDNRADAPAQVAPLAQIADGALAAAAAAISQKSLRLEVSLRSAEAAASPDLARIAIENLIDNAVKYSPAAGAVMVTVGARDAFAEFRVTNTTSRPIDQEAAQLLTEPFYRQDQPGADRAPVPGLGLGLSLVESIAHRFGGSLRIDAGQPGELTVTLSLPARAHPDLD
ncbi:MAG: hypothetical protein LBG60_06160 [Bifidobacteriaceae bacterium]|jgi:signal transduction histidine kinase|nr:hypothetical protein [Bifidobacteriaceae bacterium]